MSSANELDLVIAKYLSSQRTTADSDTELLRAHPHLAPELGQRLKTLRKLQAAADRAEQPAKPDEMSDPEREELRFLADALPDYDFTRRIDNGGQGVVFDAVHRPTSRRVALKLLLDGPLATPTQGERFAREVRVVARLAHPNIITLYDAGVVNGRRYYTMEYVEGLPIDEHIHVQRMGVEDMLRMFIDVCRALAFAHNEQVVHRDVKPSNILVDQDGRPRVVDFGLAHDDEPGSRTTRLSLTGQVFGTMPYLSPEEVGLEDDAAVDHRSDIYALGVVLYELLTGGYPYPIEGSAIRIRHNILFREPQSLRAAMRKNDSRLTPDDISDDLQAVVKMALCKDPDHRYQTADQLADDLERLLRGEPVMATRDTRLDSMRKLLRRHRQQATISLVLAASLVMSSLMWFRAEAQAEQARTSASVAYSMLKDDLKITDEMIRPLAGSGPALRKLLDEAERMLATLDDIDIEFKDKISIQALLHERIGDLERHQGNLATAQLEYETALDLLAQVDDGTPSEATAAIIRAHTKLGQSISAPMEQFELALSIGQPLIDRVAVHPEIIFATHYAHVVLAEHLYVTGEYDRAYEHANLGLTDIDNSRVEEEARWASIVGKGYLVRGRAWMKRGNGPEGLADMAHSVDILQSACERWPADTTMRHDCMTALRHNGNTRHRLDDFEGALEVLDDAAVVGRFLFVADPRVAEWRRSYSAVKRTSARVYRKQKMFEDAEKHAQFALQLIEPLMQADPVDMDTLRCAASGHDTLGHVYLDAGRLQHAEDHLLTAIALHEEKLRHGENAPSLQASIAYSLDKLGQVYREQGLLDEATEEYGRSLDIRRHLLEVQPEIIQRHLDEIISQTKVANVHLEYHLREHDLEAQAILQVALRRLHDLRDEGKLSADVEKYRRYKRAILKNLRIVEDRLYDGVTNNPRD